MATSTIKNRNRIGGTLTAAASTVTCWTADIPINTSFVLNTIGTMRALLVVDGASAGLKGLYILSGTSEGATDVKAVTAASSLTITPGTSKFTFDNGGGSGMHLLFIVYRGGISV